MKRADLADADCGIAQALGVVGDWQTLLVVREIAGGTTRFDGIQHALGLSRRSLADRLQGLVTDGVLARQAYSTHPPRHDYLLTAKGEGLVAVLAALQDWGTRHVMGDGTLSATMADTSPEARRVHALVGRRLPDLRLVADDGTARPLVAPDRWTVLYAFPGAYAPQQQAYPPGWGEIPGAAGCTLEATTYAAHHAELAAAGARVLGVSTQRPDQLAAFRASAGLPFDLVSDADSRLAVALRLPTFLVAGTERLKRVTLLVDPEGVVRAVQAPVRDPAGAVVEMLQTVRRLVPATAGSRPS